MPDAENWKIALNIYAEHPTSAPNLAYQLIAIKHSLRRGQKGIPAAVKELDQAINLLLPHTEFYTMVHKILLRAVGRAGKNGFPRYGRPSEVPERGPLFVQTWRSRFFDGFF